MLKQSKTENASECTGAHAADSARVAGFGWGGGKETVVRFRDSMDAVLPLISDKHQRYQHTSRIENFFEYVLRANDWRQAESSFRDR